jgi:hypothetical protein
MNNQKSFSLRVDELAFDKLRVIAKENNRSINAQIESLIKQCIVEHEKQYGFIKVED